MSRTNNPTPLLRLRTRKFLKSIGPYKTNFNWRYSNPVVDERVQTALKIHDYEMYRETLSWHRHHGGAVQVAEALSRYDNPSGIPMTKWLPKDREDYLLAVEDVKQLFRFIPGKESIGHIHWFKANSSNSGLPDLVPKNENHEKNVEEARRLAGYIMNTPERSFASYDAPPVIPFVRSVPTPEDKFSTRGVWGFPAAITYIESIFATPLYSRLIKNMNEHQLPLIFGPGCFARARAFIRAAHTDGSSLASTDFVKGDTQPLADKLRIVFGILEDMLDFGSQGGHRVSAEYSSKLKRLWDYVVWYFINTPIVFFDWLYRKTSGFPSGSSFTMVAWLVFNLIEKGFLFRSMRNRQMRNYDVRVGGDDSIFRTPSDMSLNDILECAARIGTIYHPLGKSMLYSGERVLFTKTLSTTFPHIFRYERDLVDTFARMVYPASWVSTTEESVGRVLTIALSTCKSMERVVRFADLYLDNAPVDLDLPVKVDRDYKKYFRYVLGLKDFLPEGTTLRSLVRSYLDDVQWTLLCFRI